MATQSHAGLFGGYGSGKSYALVLRQLMMTLRFPGVPHVIASPTYGRHKKDILPAVRAILRAANVWYREHKTEHWIRPQWCEEEDTGLWFMSCENPESLKGPNVGTIGINEPGGISKDAYDVLLSRARVALLSCAKCDAWRGSEPNVLGDRQPEAGEVLVVETACACGDDRIRVHPNFLSLAGTPEGLNWLYDEWIDEAAHPDRDWSDFRKIHVDTDQNTFLPKTYRRRLAEAYDEETAKEKLGGQFLARRKGAMYRQFDRKVNVWDLAVYDPRLPLHLTCDFNVDPLCWLIGQVHKGGQHLYIIDEIVLADVGETTNAMGVYCDRYGSHQAGHIVHGDVSGHHRETMTKGLVTDYSVIREVAKFRKLRDFSIAVAKTNNPEVRERVARVNGAMRNAAGKARAWVNPKCRVLIRDLEKQKWKPGTDIPNSEGGTLGHSADALGYLVCDVIALPERVQGVQIRA